MRAIPVVLGLCWLVLPIVDVHAQVPEKTQDSGRIVLRAPRPDLAPLVKRADRSAEVLAKARRFQDVPWVFSGRSSKGIDCIGLVFTALADTYGVKRRDFDRHNHRNAEVAARIGHVVATLTAAEARDAKRVKATLREGDVLFFLWPLENSTEPAFAALGGDALWVWHVGFATKEGAVLHAGPWLGKVAEEPLAVLVTNQSFAGVVVVRPGDVGP